MEKHSKHLLGQPASTFPSCSTFQCTVATWWKTTPNRISITPIPHIYLPLPTHLASTPPYAEALSQLYLGPTWTESSPWYLATLEDPGQSKRSIRKAHSCSLLKIQDTNILQSVHCPWKHVIVSNLLFHKQKLFSQNSPSIGLQCQGNTVPLPNLQSRKVNSNALGIKHWIGLSSHRRL